MGVEKTIDRVGEILACVTAMTNSDVLVGIPAEKTARNDGGPTNALLGHIHEYGSPVKNIPARPFLFPGIRKVRSQTVALFKQGAQDCLTGNGGIEQTLNKVGIIARNSVVNEITDPAPPFVPLKPATIRARLRKTAAGRRKLRGLKKIRSAAGWSGDKSGAALVMWSQEMVDGDRNIHPLIDTGALRQSISYIVRKG